MAPAVRETRVRIDHGLDGRAAAEIESSGTTTVVQLGTIQEREERS
jgi:hypothetical protein